MIIVIIFLTAMELILIGRRALEQPRDDPGLYCQRQG